MKVTGGASNSLVYKKNGFTYHCFIGRYHYIGIDLNANYDQAFPQIDIYSSSICHTIIKLGRPSTITIKGKVTDELSGKPIRGASVYFNGTYIGTSTDSLGTFSVRTANTNNPLIISSVGYETREIKRYYEDAVLNIILSHRIDQLQEVSITIDEMSRKNKLKIFTTEFLGEISNDCVILNPDVLGLRYNKKLDELTADAEEPLVIRNRKLGYKITYYLASFRHIPYHTEYKGNYVFAEDTAGLSRRAIQKILQARDEAYFGSRMHFIRSLWANQLTENQYKVFAPQKIQPNRTVVSFKYDENRVGYDSLVVIKNDKVYHDQKFLVFDKEIYIQYQQGKGNLETSFVKRSENSIGTLIDRDGNYGAGIEWKGSMGFTRVNGLLPFEFTPIAFR